MVEQHALIDWPLTPYTGWGNYGIQLAQALLEQGRYAPSLALAFRIARVFGRTVDEVFRYEGD